MSCWAPTQMPTSRLELFSLYKLQREASTFTDSKHQKLVKGPSDHPPLSNAEMAKRQPTGADALCKQGLGSGVANPVGPDGPPRYVHLSPVARRAPHRTSKRSESCKPQLTGPGLRVEGLGQGVSPHIPESPADGRAHSGEGSRSLLSRLRESFLSLLVAGERHTVKPTEHKGQHPPQPRTQSAWTAPRSRW